MKPSPRACRHCGSPATKNPCWWNIKSRNWCGDPPCILDEADDMFRGLRRNPTIALLSYSAAVVIVMGYLIYRYGYGG